MAYTGCDTKSLPEKDAGAKPVIGVLLYKQDDTYISLVSKAIQEALEEQAEVEVLYAGGDQLTQNEQIDALLKKKVAALAVNIVDIQAVAKTIDSIKKADIPVVFFNREPDMNTLRAYDKARFVGTKPSEAGVIQGGIIADLWERHPEYDRNKDGRWQYLMLQANLDNPEAVARTEHSVKQARQRGVVLEQATDSLLCDWDKNLAYEAMRLVLPQHGSAIELVIANNDSMALGAIKALNEIGFNLEDGDPHMFIPVVGVDAIAEAVEAIQKGMMSGTVVQDDKAMGRAVARMLMNAVEGKNFLDGLPYAWDESGYSIRIPYASYTNGN